MGMSDFCTKHGDISRWLTKKGRRMVWKNTLEMLLIVASRSWLGGCIKRLAWQFFVSLDLDPLQIAVLYTHGELHPPEGGLGKDVKKLGFRLLRCLPKISSAWWCLDLPKTSDINAPANARSHPSPCLPCILWCSLPIVYRYKEYGQKIGFIWSVCPPWPLQ